MESVERLSSGVEKAQVEWERIHGMLRAPEIYPAQVRMASHH